MLKRIISFCTVLLLLCTLMPFHTFATEDDNRTNDGSDKLQVFIENCDRRYFALSDISDFTEEDCLYARNAIFAKSGWIFSNQKLANYFHQYGWYNPTISAGEFTDDMLNEYQIANRDLIVAYESELSAEATSDNGYISVVNKAIEKVNTANPYSEGYGAVYDIDGNGVEELILVFTTTKKMSGGYDFPVKVCSLYTMSNGAVVCLIDEEELFAEAGGPSGHASVVQIDGKIYFAITSETGETGGGYCNRYGSWKLYSLHNSELNLETNITYDYYFDDQGAGLDYSNSTASFNGRKATYREYEDWVDHLEEMLIVESYRYDPTQYGSFGSKTLVELKSNLNYYSDEYRPQKPLAESIGSDSAWNSVYYDYIIEDRENADNTDDWEWVGYELVYLDDDTIPELWITYSSWAEGCRIVSYRDGKITQELTGSGRLSYEEYGNVFHHSYGHMGLYFDTIFKLENGELVTVAEGRNETTINDDGSQNYDVMNYFWNDIQVSEEVYVQNIDSLVSPAVAKETSDDAQLSYDEILDYLSTLVIAPNEQPVMNQSERKLAVYSDHTGRELSIGSIITLGAVVLSDGNPVGNATEITFQIADPSILSVVSTYDEDQYRYVKFKGLEAGTTNVAFNDSATGSTVVVPITVFEKRVHSYTLSNVPTQQIDKYPTNFYNVNGLYVDSYEYTVNEDQSATISFDVYNTNYSYGTVEVFDENGNLKDAVLIDKMTSSNTGFKEAVLDNLGYLVRDIFQGDLLSYRQESGFSKMTSVCVKVPKNGYITICMDPEESSVVGLVNYADLLLSMLDLTGEITGFSAKSKEFSGKLTAKIVNEKIFAELVSDSDKMTQTLWKNIGKETLVTSESMGDFIDTAIKNLSEFGLLDVICTTASDCGWSIGEKVFTDLAGPFGTALKIMFSVGKVENIIIQHHDVTHLAECGCIVIQNQGGGIRSCQQIKVENEDGFDDDTALNVFSVTLEADLLDLVEKYSPEIYDQIVGGITYTYNISLMKDGNETQPDGEVTVYIPIPDELKVLAYAGELTDGSMPVNIKIYRVEEDGSLTEMDVRVEDGCFVFTTDHFSLYTIVGFDAAEDVQNPEPENNNFAVITIAAAIAAVVVLIAVCAKKKKR